MSRRPPSNHRLLHDVRSTRGSSRPVLAIVLLIVVVIGGTFIMREQPPMGTTKQPALSGIQGADANDTRAYYIAQTALDRSVKHLARDPRWRDGFKNVAFESGHYSVTVFDEGSAPADHVRIVASSEVDGVSRSLEAVWVNTLAAFDYVLAAGDELELANHGSNAAALVGSFHNNAWQGGDLSVGGGMTIYGDVTSAGRIIVGDDAHIGDARVIGNLTASDIAIGAAAEILAFENLNEREIRIDLNGDGDTRDFGVGAAPLEVRASRQINAGASNLRNAAYHTSVGGGMVRVQVGEAVPGPVFDPRPDFTQYYELACGKSSYPPGIDHAVNEIPGDGRGHYFASSAAFVAYLDFQIPQNITCVRCAGDGTVGPEAESACGNCYGRGRESVVEIAGVYYIDDALLDLSAFANHVVVHGTIVVAQGDPYAWPSRTVMTPAGETVIEHFPERGSFVMRGSQRPYFTQTYRSSLDTGAYPAQMRALRAGRDEQTITIESAHANKALTNFPGLIAADRIELEARASGFAYHPGDIGDEAITTLQGVIYAENRVSLHGRGGHRSGEVIFNEREGLSGDDELDEAVLSVDLNGDGDIFDRVDVASISAVPAIEIGPGKYGVDLNADGVLDRVAIGADYAAFFDDNGYALPTLIYLEGCVLSQAIHCCEQVGLARDPRLAGAGMPYGFGVSYGLGARDGLVSWSEVGE